MKLIGAAVCALLIAVTAESMARAGEPVSPPSSATDTPQPVPVPPEPASPRDTFLVASLSTAGISATALVLGTFAWWKDAGYTGWAWRNTGFFGRDTYAGGSDKAGHFYANWVGVRVMRGIYRALGVSSPNDLWLGAAFIAFLGTSIDVVDGFTRYGFEYADVMANSLGLVAAILAERYPAFDALLGFRFGYVPTQYWVRHDKNYIRTINDYTGMIFYLDLKPAGLEEALGIDPGAARYLSFGVSWNTYGYSPRDKDFDKRNLGVHLSLNVSEILLRVFEKGTFGVEAAARTSRYVAWPYTEVIFVQELNHEASVVNFGVANRSEVKF